MWNKGFEGWYFKHQKGGDTIAFIPGRAESGAFVQMISPEGSRQFPVPSLSVENDVIRAGACVFSPRGCAVALPGVSGRVAYGPFSSLKSDVMGPFRFFPMECRHGVLSMAHTLAGGITVGGTRHNFDGGRGYLEKDSGTSFPSSYLWLQCNDFPERCALMASVACVPFCGGCFTGCICAVLYGGREYRIATYRGARIREAGAERLRLSQGALVLQADISRTGSGHPLRAPVRGKMSAVIRESADAGLRFCLWERGRRVIDLCSSHAAFEYVPPKEY